MHIHRNIIATALLVACAALPLAACSSNSTAAPATTATSAATSAGATTSPANPAAADKITISNFMFQPMAITVAPGAKVTVTNTDTATHTLTSTGTPPAFDTGDIATGKSVTFTAPTKPGKYAYICQIHQYMQGTLTVS
jgi:plastocyanin